MDPIFVPIAPPTLPPAKPTKIIGLPARWVLITWCLAVILVTPVGTYYASNICSHSLHTKPIIGLGSMYAFMYFLFFLAALCKFKENASDGMLRMSFIMPIFDFFFLLAMLSDIITTYEKIRDGSVNATLGHIIVQEFWDYCCVLLVLLAVDILTAAMVPRALRDIKKPNAVVAPEYVELVDVSANQ